MSSPVPNIAVKATHLKQQGAAELIAAGVLPLIRAVNCPNLSQVDGVICDKTAEINRELTNVISIAQVTEVNRELTSALTIQTI